MPLVTETKRKNQSLPALPRKERMQKQEGSFARQGELRMTAKQKSEKGKAKAPIGRLRSQGKQRQRLPALRQRSAHRAGVARKGGRYEGNGEGKSRGKGRPAHNAKCAAPVAPAKATANSKAEAAALKAAAFKS